MEVGTDYTLFTLVRPSVQKGNDSTNIYTVPYDGGLHAYIGVGSNYEKGIPHAQITVRNLNNEIVYSFDHTTPTNINLLDLKVGFTIEVKTWYAWSYDNYFGSFDIRFTYNKVR